MNNNHINLWTFLIFIKDVVQFLDDEKEDMCNETANDNCSFFDKSIEKIVKEEKKIIDNITDKFDSTKEWTLSHFNNLPEWLQGESMNNLIKFK